MARVLFFNCCVRGNNEANLKDFNILSKNYTLLSFPHTHFPASWRIFCIIKWLLLLISQVRVVERGLSWARVGYFIPGLRDWASANRQFSSSLAQAPVKAVHSFCAICFTFPHGVGACKRLLSTKLFLIKSPSSGVMINTN